MNQMKRAELIIGKAYYTNESANWRDKAYAKQSYAETGKIINRRKVIVIETQLKTEYERKYQSREVLIQNSQGEQKWVALNHIRCTWVEAVKILSDDQRRRLGYDDRDNKYARHLARKVQREQYNPAYKAMVNTLNELTGDGIYGWDKMENGFSLEQLKTINEALSLLKTQRPTLTAVAS
jgi:hypothetical protein